MEPIEKRWGKARKLLATAALSSGVMVVLSGCGESPMARLDVELRIDPPMEVDRLAAVSAPVRPAVVTLPEESVVQQVRAPAPNKPCVRIVRKVIGNGKGASYVDVKESTACGVKRSGAS